MSYEEETKELLHRIANNTGEGVPDRTYESNMTYLLFFVVILLCLMLWRVW